MHGEQGLDRHLRPLKEGVRARVADPLWLVSGKRGEEDEDDGDEEDVDVEDAELMTRVRDDAAMTWVQHGAALMERDEPYHLPVELARGTLNRIRNQLAAWQSLGFRLPDETGEKIAAEITRLYAGA